MQWIVDGSIHLSEICTTQKWIWKDCITALEAAGLSMADAELYAGFAFGTDAVYQRSVSDESMTAEEYARISIQPSGDGMHTIGPPI